MLSEFIVVLVVIEVSCFDLVLLDLNLVGESGLKFLIDMLCIQFEVCIVMLIVYVSVVIVVDVIKWGVDNYLCKLIKISDIVVLFEVELIVVDEEEVELEYLMLVDCLEWEYV